jgi:hypothetical protein
MSIEQFLRTVAFQPVFQQLQVFGMIRIDGNRHLVRAERAFDLQAIDPFGTGPAFGRLEHDHRPTWADEVAVGADVVLDVPDLLHRLVEGRSHGVVHQLGLMTLDEVRRPATAAEKLFQFLWFDTCELVFMV